MLLIRLYTTRAINSWMAAYQVAEQLQSLSMAAKAQRDGLGASEGVPADEGGGRAAPVLARWPEFAGAFLLYFVCIPPTPQVGCPPTFLCCFSS